MQKSLQQQLCDKIYEILPHKKELEFGCKIKIDSEEHPFLNKDIIYIANCKPNGLNEVKIIDYSNWIKVTAISEIIGQPLRLADLLLAINIKGVDISTSLSNKYFCFDGFSLEENRDVLLAEYNLQDDNILNQSDELCEFCLGVLDNK